MVAESKESAERTIKERYDESLAYSYYEAEEVSSVDGYNIIITKLVDDET